MLSITHNHTDNEHCLCGGDYYSNTRICKVCFKYRLIPKVPELKKRMNGFYRAMSNEQANLIKSQLLGISSEIEVWRHTDKKEPEYMERIYKNLKK